MMSYCYLSVGKDIHINKNHPNQKHLTLSDRVYIEQELLQGSTFRSIAHTFLPNLASPTPKFNVVVVFAVLCEASHKVGYGK